MNNGFFPSFAVQGCDHFPFSIIINGQSKVIMSRARPTTTEDIRIFFAKMTCLIGAKEEMTSRCLKITEKVSFNMASEASYVYLLDKSLSKVPKMIHFGEFLKTSSLRSNSVTRQVTFIKTKINRNCQN